ncbi:MAG: hypothetical protein WD876_00590 [Candidatus Pacearchaeota archaeon]
MVEKLVLKVESDKKLEEFVKCFESLKGKFVKIQDKEEVLITGTVDRDYDFLKNQNYRLLNAVPLISSETVHPQESYIGEFRTITEIYSLD